MATLGMDIVAGTRPSLRLWLAESAVLADPNVFLVRAGRSPVFAGVCGVADMYNWPDSETEDVSWYRSAGLSLPLEDSEDLLQIRDWAQAGVDSLELALSETPVESTETYTLRYFRTGLAFGEMGVDRTNYLGSVSLEISITLSAEGLAALFPNGLFVLGNESTDLLRVLTLADGADGSSISYGETMTDSIEIWLGETGPTPTEVLSA